MTNRRIAIVTDSGSGLPPRLAEENDIHIVPFRLIWDGQVYRDGVDMTSATFYRRLRTSHTLPTTSTPNLGDLVAMYQRLGQDAEGIVSIHAAERLSSAIAVARQAAREAQVPVHVIDSGSGASPQGFVALAAARAVRAGAPLESVVDVAQAYVRRVGMLFTLKTLRYVQRGGRIGEAAALLGSQLNIQPVLTVAQGQVRPVAITRSRKAAKARMVQELQRLVGRARARIAVFHGDVAEEAAEFGQRVREGLDVVDFFLVEFTPAVGAHAGPGIIGAAYCLEDGMR